MENENTDSTKEKFDQLIQTLSEYRITFDDLSKKIQSQSLDNTTLYAPENNIKKYVKDEFFTNRELTEGQKLAKQFANLMTEKLLNGDEDNAFIPCYSIYQKLDNDRDRVLAHHEVFENLARLGKPNLFELTSKADLVKQFHDTCFNHTQTQDMIDLVSRMYQFDEGANTAGLCSRLAAAYSTIANDYSAFLESNNGQHEYHSQTAHQITDAIGESELAGRPDKLTETHEKIFSQIAKYDLDFIGIAKNIDNQVLATGITDNVMADNVAHIIVDAYFTQKEKNGQQAESKNIAIQFVDGLIKIESGTIIKASDKQEGKKALVDNFFSEFNQLDNNRDKILAAHEISVQLESRGKAHLFKTNFKCDFINALNNANENNDLRNHGINLISGGYKVATLDLFRGLAKENLQELKESIHSRNQQSQNSIDKPKFNFSSDVLESKAIGISSFKRVKPLKDDDSHHPS